MKKRILILCSALIILLSACVTDNNASVGEESSDNSFTDNSKAEWSYIVSEYMTYNPHETAHFHASVAFIASYKTSVADYEAFLISQNPDAVTIALITLENIDFENATEYMPEGKPTERYRESFCLTPITVTIDKILMSEAKVPLDKNQRLSSTVYDRWKKQPDGSYNIEYYANGFPMCEQGKQYIAAIIETDNGFVIEALSFPVEQDGSYTESILKHKNSDCFENKHWSFSDEILKKYGITE